MVELDGSLPCQVSTESAPNIGISILLYFFGKVNLKAGLGGCGLLWSQVSILWPLAATINWSSNSDTWTLYCTVLYCTVLYCTVLYCTVLYCTVSVLPSWKLSGVEILANKARGPRAEGFISQYSHSTQFLTG